MNAGAYISRARVLNLTSAIVARRGITQTAGVGPPIHPHRNAGRPRPNWTEQRRSNKPFIKLQLFGLYAPLSQIPGGAFLAWFQIHMHGSTPPNNRATVGGP